MKLAWHFEIDLIYGLGLHIIYDPKTGFWIDLTFICFLFDIRIFTNKQK